MVRYLVEKGASLVAVEFGITLVVFFLIRLVPGDVVDYLYGQYMSRQRLDEVRALFGLDKTVVQQYSIGWAALHTVISENRCSAAGRSCRTSRSDYLSLSNSRC